jgi:hypothetical protein
LLKTIRINQVLRIPKHIPVGIEPAGEPDGIGLQVTPKARRVVAEVVLVVAGDGVVVLAREAVVVGERAGQGMGLAEGREGAVPEHGLGGVGDLLRRVQVVGMDIADGAAVDPRERQPAQPDELDVRGAGGVGLGDRLTAGAGAYSAGFEVDAFRRARLGLGSVKALFAAAAFARSFSSFSTSAGLASLGSRCSIAFA